MLSNFFLAFSRSFFSFCLCPPPPTLDSLAPSLLLSLAWLQPRGSCPWSCLYVPMSSALRQLVWIPVGLWAAWGRGAHGLASVNTGSCWPPGQPLWDQPSSWPGTWGQLLAQERGDPRWSLGSECGSPVPTENSPWRLSNPKARSYHRLLLSFLGLWGKVSPFCSGNSELQSRVSKTFLPIPDGPKKKKNFLVSLFHCLTGKLIPYLNKVSTYFVPDTATLLGTFIHTLRLGGETIPYVSPPLVEKAKLLGVG